MKNPIVFPYKIYHGVNYYPMATIELEWKSQKIFFDAYVDSGASLSIFSIQEARRLNLDYKKGEKISITVGDGTSIPVYLHLLLVQIGTVSFKATIGFSPKLGVGFNLVGRKDFFTFFDITFSDSDKILTFTPRY